MQRDEDSIATIFDVREHGSDRLLLTSYDAAEPAECADCEDETPAAQLSRDGRCQSCEDGRTDAAERNADSAIVGANLTNRR
jgi:hypothetical protein